MTSKKWNIGRRTMLRSLTTGLSAAVGLPILESMLNPHGEAFAEDGAPIPVRYGVFFWGNGVRPDRWVPNKVGDRWWTDPNEELIDIANNAAVRERVSVMSGFDLYQSGVAHHHSRAQVLCGHYDADIGNFGAAAGPSSDWIVRQQWAGQSQLRDAVDVGISQTQRNGPFVINSGSVFNDQGNAQPLEMSPRSLFDGLFGNGLPDAIPDDASFQNSRFRLVDLVREDASRLRHRLGRWDQLRLDDHLAHLDDVDRAIEALGSDMSCSEPQQSAEMAEYYRRQVNITQNGEPATITGELLVEKNAVMSELIALSLACDLTRVFNVQHHSMQSDCIFWMLPTVSLGFHQSTHDDRPSNPDEPTGDYEAVHEIATFVMSQFNVLLDALARIPEGANDLLHNCAIYATSEYGDATTHSGSGMVALVAGRAGGALAPGAHHAGQGRNLVEVPLTVMKAVGLDIDHFGGGDARADESFDALLS